MKKKIALVTGASSGIGKAIALDLAKQNYHLILLDRNQRTLKLAYNQLIITRHPVDYFVVDVSYKNAILNCIEEIVRRYGRIDLLINNAGVFSEGTTTLALDKLEEMIQINLLGAIYVAQTVAKQMKKQGSGYIINMASLAGKRSFSNLGGYSASKFGLLGFNDALFKEMLDYHVKVTAICPSVVNTPMMKDFDMKRSAMIQPRDIVRTVNYLLSLDFNSAISEIEINCAEIVLDWE